ncbi:MAG: hypothetical protein RLZZ175_2142 [Bacteroidota bacterium]|jgi:hypothetical protein
MKKHYYLIAIYLISFISSNAQTVKSYLFNNYNLENNFYFFGESNDLNRNTIYIAGLNQKYYKIDNKFENICITPHLSYIQNLSSKWFLNLKSKVNIFNVSNNFKYRQIDFQSTFYHAGKIGSIDFVKKISFEFSNHSKIVNSLKTGTYNQLNSNFGLLLSKKININSLPLRFNASCDIYIFRPFDVDIYENYSSLLIDGTSIKADLTSLLFNSLFLKIYIQNTNEFISNSYLKNIKLQLITPTYGAELSYFFNYQETKSPSFIF